PPSTPYIYTLSLHDALPILPAALLIRVIVSVVRLNLMLPHPIPDRGAIGPGDVPRPDVAPRAGHLLPAHLLIRHRPPPKQPAGQDRKSTRLNSSHRTISYAV